MFKRIWAEIDRIWEHQARAGSVVDDRITLLERHVDDVQNLYNERLVVMQDRQDILEGRIRAVDRWMMEIGSLIGAGVPLEGIERDTEIEGFDAESELEKVLGRLGPVAS